MTAPRRVLGVFPHPDDEAYAAGGTLARCALAGARVEILCATRGEAGAPRPGSGVPADADLAAVRAAELAAACRALGCAPPAFLDLPDGRLDEVPDDTGAACIGEHLERLRPDLVITLGRDGVYGHRDHLAVTRWVDRAAVALPDGPPRVLHAVFPRGLFAPIRRALRRSPAADRLADGPLGVDPGAVDLTVDVRPVRDRKLAAVAAHRSQLVGGDPLSFLRPGLLAALLEREWFVRAAGPPLPAGAGDPLAAP